MLRKYWCELCDVVVEGVIMVVVSVSHLEEGPVDFHHLILEGPVRVSEVPAGVLHLQFIIVMSFISSLGYMYVFTSTVLVSIVILNVVWPEGTNKEPGP